MALLAPHKWPVVLTEGELQLRPLRLRDRRRWRAVRTRNDAWLRQWEATLPLPDPQTPTSFTTMVRLGNKEARAGRALPFGLFLNGELIGQITVAGIAWSSLRNCHIGYWIDEAHAGRGIMPRAVALAADYCFGTLRLHRIEINIRPENEASLAVVRKLGFRDEGVRKRYLHIGGAWCDHRTFALTAEERPQGMRAWRWQKDRSDRSLRSWGD